MGRVGIIFHLYHEKAGRVKFSSETNKQTYPIIIYVPKGRLWSFQQKPAILTALFLGNDREKNRNTFKTTLLT